MNFKGQAVELFCENYIEKTIYLRNQWEGNATLFYVSDMKMGTSRNF